jgi:hypothetical protein
LLLLGKNVDCLLYLVNDFVDIHHVGFRLKHCTDLAPDGFLFELVGILLLTDAHVVQLLDDVLLLLEQVLSDTLVALLLLQIRFELALECIELKFQLFNLFTEQLVELLIQVLL